MKNYFKYLFIVIIFLCPFAGASTAEISRETAGYILLQVEERGEAWYVHPDSLMRYYLGRPQDAWQIMREQGIGISNDNLAKIPIGLDYLMGADIDQDGLPNNLEKALGTDSNIKDSDNDGFNDYEEMFNNFDPWGDGILPIDVNFINQHKGRIFLQVEGLGEAWYIYPKDGKRYYLGRPEDAFNIMRNLGLGITNQNIENINALSYNYNYSSLEEKIFTLINKERADLGLEALEWNNQLAVVARDHTAELVRENESITGLGFSCDYPLIHHEGSDFGLYSHDRLNNHEVYYYSKSGENIALYSAAEFTVRLGASSPARTSLNNCSDDRVNLDQEFKIVLENLEDDKKTDFINTEIKNRIELFNKSYELEIASINWHSEDELAKEITQGWMESPGHKKNIVTPEYDESGMGVFLIDGYVIATQVFINRAECGYSGGSCCAKEGFYPYCYLPLKCDSENICG